MTIASCPNKPKIYHITHFNNLQNIVDTNRLLSDAERISQNLDSSLVGMRTIKQRRLEELEVDCYPGSYVGEFVPFYFCPRSIMLYLLHMGNHMDIEYRGGQNPIVHLQADMKHVIQWADKNDVRWAFSDSNAGGRLASFYNNVSDLNKIQWHAVNETDFRDAKIKEGKQAEFLVENSFPWELFDIIGVINSTIESQVRPIIENATHKPTIKIKENWYY